MFEKFKKSKGKIILAGIASLEELKELEKEGYLPSLVELTDEELLYYKIADSAQIRPFHNFYEDFAFNPLSAMYEKNYFSLSLAKIYKENKTAELKGIIFSETNKVYPISNVSANGFDVKNSEYENLTISNYSNPNYINLEELNISIASKEQNANRNI